MKRILVFLVFMIIPSAAFADIGPFRNISCDECIYRCFDCCTMQDIVPMPGCGSCYHGSCDFKAICADYLAQHPDKCPDNTKPGDPDSDVDENNLPKPELSDSDVDNTQPKTDNIEDPSQMPPPVTNKRSCSAMIYSPGQTGIWAILVASLLGLLALIVRRRCR